MLIYAVMFFGFMSTVAASVVASCESFILAGAYAPDGIFGVFYYNDPKMIAVPVVVGIVVFLAGAAATFTVLDALERRA
jgi:hypothetical protein